MSTRAIALAVLVSVAVVACGRQKPTGGATASVASQHGADSELLAALEHAAKACDINLDVASVTCLEKSRLIASFLNGQRRRIAALPTLTRALKNTDRRLQTVAATVMYAAFRADLGRDADSDAVSRTLALELIDAVARLSPPQAKLAAATAVHAAMLSGQSEALDRLLAPGQNAAVRGMGQRHLMTYGRLDAFPKIQELGASAEMVDVLAALESPRNMRDWTDQEQAAICAWGRTFLLDARPIVASTAGALFVHCEGKHLDGLLDDVEAALNKDTLAVAHVAAVRELCSPVRLRDRNAPPQCGRIRRLLTQILHSRQAPSPIRKSALAALVYQFGDSATLREIRRAEKTGDPRLRATAQRFAQRLEHRLAKEKRRGGPLEEPSRGARK